MNKILKKGQILLEFIWLIVFISSFLTSVLYLYEKGNYEIKKYQLGNKSQNEIHIPVY